VGNGGLKHRDLDRFSGVADWRFWEVKRGDLRFPTRGSVNIRPVLVNPWCLNGSWFSSSCWELDMSDWELMRVLFNWPRGRLWFGGCASWVWKTFLKKGDVGWKKIFL
jgi:hypothetical protein